MMIFMNIVKCMVSKVGCLVQIQIVSSCVTWKKNFIVFFHLGFPCDSDSKEPPTKRETWVRSLGWEDPLEKRKATHSSILAWRIPWTVRGVAKSWALLSDFHFHSAYYNFYNKK